LQNIGEFYDRQYNTPNSPYESITWRSWAEYPEETQREWLQLVTSLNYFLRWGLVEDLAPTPPPSTETDEESTDDDANDETETNPNGNNNGTETDEESNPSPEAIDNSEAHHTEVDATPDEIEILSKYRCIYFEGENQSKLSSTSQDTAKILATSMQKHIEVNPDKEFVVFVESFCTTTDGYHNNQILAQARTDNTEAYIKSLNLGIITNQSQDLVGIDDIYYGATWNNSSEGRQYNADTGGEQTNVYTKPAGEEEPVALAKTRHKNRRSSIRLFQKNGDSYTEVAVNKKK
jgi:outer membrane protein OmpA-like peptidoglycan-associated protein